MFGIENFSLFIISGILLNLTPGVDTFYIIGRSVSQGRMAGIISVFGVITGVFIHTIAVAFGLSAILATSSIAFTIIKYLGAFYLIYLGIQAFRKKNEVQYVLGNTKYTEKKWKIYKQGVLSNTLNPKIALFFLSFLPQFVDPLQNYGVLPFILLGITFAITGLIWCLILAIFSSHASKSLRNNSKFNIILNKLSGGLFVLLGLKLLTLEKN